MILSYCDNREVAAAQKALPSSLCFCRIHFSCGTGVYLTIGSTCLRVMTDGDTPGHDESGPYAPPEITYKDGEPTILPVDKAILLRYTT